MKLAKLLSLVLVFIMLFSLLAVSASAILCEDQENVNEQGVVYAEKNGPTKSAKGYLAVGGEIRPEDDEAFGGVRPPFSFDGFLYEQYLDSVTGSAK
ncbi:MAG: hypothetical protein IJG40_08910 [Oscillospiraceae bacterium]|nr:hypothetical protein [Oscillospiraceae bacterium]